MGRNPFNIGTEEKGGLGKTLFYFFKEFGIYPFDVEYRIKIEWEKWFWKFKKIKTIKIIKLGMSLALFNELLKEMSKHYKRESEEMKRASRKR